MPDHRTLQKVERSGVRGVPKQQRKVDAAADVQAQIQAKKAVGLQVQPVIFRSISVEKFFHPDNARVPLKMIDVTNSLPKKMFLEHKYSHKLANCKMILQETRSILRQKDGYRTWLDCHNNSPIKSPNYTRV